MSVALWQQCIDFLRDELPSQQFNTWIRPLQVDGDQAEIRLYAPNRFVLDWVNDKYLNRIQELLDDLSQGQAPMVSLLATWYWQWTSASACCCLSVPGPAYKPSTPLRWTYVAEGFSRQSITAAPAKHPTLTTRSIFSVKWYPFWRFYKSDRDAIFG